MTKTMGAAVLHGIGDIRFQEVDIPTLGRGEVLVKVRTAGVCGSDLPRVLTIGTYHFPTILGHEFAGEVVDLGQEVTKVTVGEKVTVIPLIPCRKCEFCEMGRFGVCENYDFLGSRSDGGFCQFAKVPASNLVRLPEGVDYESGALAEPAAVALSALQQGGGLQAGDEVAVFGLGPIGNLVAQWALALGANKVFGVDIVPERLKTGLMVGITRGLNAKEEDPVLEILEETQGKGVDISVEATGANRALEQSLRITRKLGKVILVGRPDADVTICKEAMEGILRKQLRIYGAWSFSSKHYPHHVWETCLGFMQEEKIKVKPLITHRFPLHKVKEVFEMMARQIEYFNKVLLLPN